MCVRIFMHSNHTVQGISCYHIILLSFSHKRVNYHAEISSTPDNEGYFFCKRGRKYRNSVRPNRVTGSGFWKATGIDKPVYSDGGEGQDCIGLKKTLVYYRGTAGKGTKTDWMMNEFRLPSDDRIGNTNVTNAKTTLPEAVS